jgi:hypothetical protein
MQACAEVRTFLRGKEPMRREERAEFGGGIGRGVVDGDVFEGTELRGERLEELLVGFAGFLFAEGLGEACFDMAWARGPGKEEEVVQKEGW